MIRTVVFDIGQVLLTYTPQAYVAARYKDDFTCKQLLTTLFLSDHWLALDRGITNYETVIEELSNQYSDYTESHRDLLYHWTSMLQPIASHVEVVKKLHEEGFGLYYLSNFQHLAFEEMMEVYDFFALFDGGVVSYQEKLMKPEPAIYQLLLSRYHLNPEECIFADDSKENIEAAKALGFHTIHVTPECQLDDEIRALILQTNN